MQALGFDGPYSGTRHHFMVWGERRQTIPSNAEYSVPQVRMLVRQVEAILGRTILVEEWSRL
ncbi:MAG: type II toxin-antitoxin system HicA family toxin [Opitutus sp.]|nr:type II toxin-antitoxin system HicA family toxin [Opitutus sp.]